MPGMDRIEAYYVCAFVLLVAGVFALVMLRRAIKKLVLWLDRRGWINYSGDPRLPSYGTAGNAFLALQAIMEPQKKYVLEIKQEEKAEQEDEGGPDRAGRRRRRRRRRRIAARRRS